MARLGLGGALLLGVVASACGGDDAYKPTTPHDSGTGDGSVTNTGSKDGGMDGGNTLLDAALDGSQPGNDGSVETTVDGGLALVERGRYLVENVGACGDCHTPRNQDHSPNQALKLSGVDCFADAFPMDDTQGCLSSRNLTNDETGLKNRSDAEIKDMFLHGMRPDGKFLSPVMPYYVLGNMKDGDADAIVAYLRTLPAVNHMVKAAQFPFADTPAATPTWPQANIPQPRSDYPDQAAALRGRYLAGEFGICMECHTARDESEHVLTDRAFEGGRAFPRETIGLDAPWPAVIYSSNLTPDTTGIATYTVDDVVAALKQGIDNMHKPLCPPMPAGPMAAFGGLTDADATDIAHYLLSLPPKANMLANTCSVPGT